MNACPLIVESEWPYENEKYGKAVFILKPLDSLQFMEVSNSIEARAGGWVPKTEFRKNILANGLKGWRGVTDDKGNEIPFSQDALRRVPPQVLTEISDRILQISIVQAGIEKNS